ACKTPTTIRSRPNKLYGTAKATPIGRRRRPAVKSVGKPDALIGHVRFDERGRETERLAKPQAAAPFLDSTHSGLGKHSINIVSHVHIPFLLWELILKW